MYYFSFRSKSIVIYLGPVSIYFMMHLAHFTEKFNSLCILKWIILQSCFFFAYNVRHGPSPANWTAELYSRVADSIVLLSLVIYVFESSMLSLSALLHWPSCHLISNLTTCKLFPRDLNRGETTRVSYNEFGGHVGVQKEEVHLTTLCTHGKFLHWSAEIAERPVLLSPANR